MDENEDIEPGTAEWEAQQPVPSTSGKADFPPIDPRYILEETRGPIGHEREADLTQPLPPPLPWMQGRYPGLHPTMSPNVSVAPVGVAPDIESQLAKLLVPQLRDRGQRQSNRTVDLNEGVNYQQGAGQGPVKFDPRSPSLSIVEDPMMAAYFGAHTPLSVAAGSKDLEQAAQRFSPPDRRRDVQLRMDEMDMAMLKRYNELPDYLKRMIDADRGVKPADKANEFAQSAIHGAAPEWEGKNAPTQADIDKMNESPTDAVLESFEQQFGEGSAGKWLRQGNEKD